MTPADPLAAGGPEPLPARTLALGLLAGHVAHELNNLLTAVLGYGELLLGDLVEGGRPRADALRVVEAAQRARELSVGVLGLPRGAEAPRALDLGGEVQAVLGLLGTVTPSSVELRPGADGRGLLVRVEAGGLRATLLALGAALLGALRDEGGWIELECSGPARSAAPGGGASASGGPRPPHGWARIALRHAGRGPAPARAAEDLRLAHALVAALAARSGGAWRAAGTPREGSCELDLPLEAAGA